jgi:F5/8 type C domain/Pectate lyase superfamily protein/Abnormal spindle-like microcephaly-assoc'd, ASPM-SPD-2-Hydin
MPAIFATISSRGWTRRGTAAASALVTALALLSVTGFTRPAPAQSTPGANVPFTEYDAVNAATNGTIIGPDTYFGTLASEATGREAVELAGQGQYVQFTLTKSANAVDFHYAIPDSTDGSGLTAPLSLYVNGSRYKSLSLTSKYSWLYGSYPFTNDPTDGLGHDFYNDVRLKFSSTLPVGTTVKLQVGSGDDAPWYVINTADFETVPGAVKEPSGYINATQPPYDADKTGKTDSTTAIQDAINAAQAAGTGVYLPRGTYLVSAPLNVNDVTVTGAGPWYTKITGNDAEFNGNQNPASTNVTVSNLSIFGTVNVRNDSDSEVNGVNGGFSDSTFSNLWIQNTKVGMWIDGPCTDLTITGVRIQDTTADGVNFDGGVTNSTVENTFTRNTQDDGMAMWSNGTADTGDTFTQDTVDSPGLANNFAIYGGSGDSITNDIAQDTVTQGGGIQIANRFSSVPLSGTTTVSGNLLERTGQFDPNWHFGVGAIWLYADDSAMTGTINITNNTIENSPYEAFQFIGSNISNVNISDNTVTGVGTYVFQNQAPGSVSVSGVTATGVGQAGVYDCGSGMTITQGSGNSGWSTTVCGFPASWPLDVSPTMLTFENQAVGSTSSSQPVTILNAGTASTTIGSIAASGAFSQTNNCGSSLASDSTCTVNVTFTPSASGLSTGTLSIPSGEPANPDTVRLAGTTGGGGSGCTTKNLALCATMTASGYTDDYVPSNANDGNADTYWESTDNDFPQWLEANLGSAHTVGSITLDLPPLSDWNTRTQTIEILGSTDGTTWTTLEPATGYTFNPSTGNTVTISLPSSKVQYLQLYFTANTVWPAGQISEFQIFK